MKKLIFILLLTLPSLAFSQGKKANADLVAPVPEIEIAYSTLKLGMTKEQIEKQYETSPYNIAKFNEDLWMVFKNKDQEIASFTFKNNKVIQIIKHWNIYLAKDNILSMVTVICDVLTEFNNKYGNENYKVYTKTLVDKGVVSRNIWIISGRRTLLIQSADYTASADRSDIRTTIDIKEAIN